jgi:hypothetical protein
MIVPPTTSRAGHSVLDVVAQAPRPLPVHAATPPATTPSCAPLVTEHALLVLLGKFAQHLGLVRLLEVVPLPRRPATIAHRPK